jgi:hypothetical protein
MFDSCTSLSTIEIPNTVTTIEERGFYNCSSLEYLLIPASVSTIGNNGFMWCNKIKTLVFDGFSAAPTSFAASTFSQ